MFKNNEQKYELCSLMKAVLRKIIFIWSPKITSVLIHIALRADAGTYYINGNWRIQLPGDVNADGTIFRYMRKGTLEKIVARGPTNAPLHIMVRNNSKTRGSTHCFNGVLTEQKNSDFV